MSDPAGIGRARWREQILLTGATGYVGGRLLRRFEDEGRPVRCMTRRPEALVGSVRSSTTIVAGDALQPSSLGAALEGVKVPDWVTDPLVTFTVFV